MKRYIIILAILPMLALAQRNTAVRHTEPAPSRDITLNEKGHATIRWEFPRYTSINITENNTQFKRIALNGFGYLHQTGKPDLPAYIDHLAIPDHADIDIQLSNIKYYPVEDNIKAYPSQPPRQDNYRADDPPFTMDTAFYNKDVVFPSEVITIDKSQDFKNIKVGKLSICPFRYNPGKQNLRQIKSIEIQVTFPGGQNLIRNPNNYSSHSASLANSYFLNGNIIAEKIRKSSAKTAPKDPNYLIITPTAYSNAAQKLAEWKSQLGYRTEIIQKSAWSSGQVKNSIHTRYNNYTPKPDYFVIIGDQGDVPGEILSSNGNTYPSDLYYSCMGGSGDNTADMAKGRISASSVSEANLIVDKIINYEKTPVSDSSFYNTGLNCAYFQHNGGGYAERRFAQTSEELRGYAVNQGYNVHRVYTTGSNVNPMYWNNGLYSAGEPLPSNLKKPNFAWNGDKYDIINHVNNGAFYVFHRDHGFEHGWGDPSFTNNDVSSLNNGAKTPVFFSINCLTGKFSEPESFTEKLLRKSNGGAVGVFGHSEVSYSGYNDALALGAFDGIWSNPGLVPNFTGSGGISNPTLPPHGNIRTMGDLVNHSLARMEASWGSSKYTHELYHYFGDPAMRIRVDYPDPIAATNPDSILCNNDTTIILNNINTSGVTATLIQDGKIYGKDILSATSDTLSFKPVVGNFALLTLSKPGYKPYVDTITITGGCPKAKIKMGISKFCIGDSIKFSSLSSGNISTYYWNFGNSASIVSDSSMGPHTISYATGGQKTVYHTVTTPNSLSHTDSVSFYIDPVCKYSLPSTGNQVIEKCSGKLFDDGGALSSYTNNSDGSVTIDPPGASSIALSFQSFHYESSYDYLKIYDGPSTSAPLIGSYDGNSLPGGGVINSTSGSITIKQETDSYVNESGFELNWQCSYPNTPPSADFNISDSVTCTGIVDFTDMSIFGPISWHWDFGDGQTSNKQHPTHQYTSNGTYTVKLVVSNSYGADSLIKSNKISVNIPSTPTAQDGIRCKTGTVQLTANNPVSANGYIRWFNTSSSPTVLDTGNLFTTPIIGNSRSYFIDHAKPKTPVYGAKTDNSGGGRYFDSNYEHHLVFDVHKPSKLVSVLVYANTSGYRTIKLRDKNGNVLESSTINITQGQQRITLNYNLPPGDDYELAGPKSPNLYRNNSGLNYPYVVNDLITIKHSSASSDPTGYYYYFYDWKVQGPPCHSPRVEVKANISDTLKPVTDFSYTTNDPEIHFTDNSQYVQSHQWSFGDGNTSALPNPDHTYTANGTYDVMLKTINNCGTDSITKQIQITAAAIESYKKNRLEAYPNPATDHINIELPGQLKGDVIVQVINEAGQHVKASVFETKGKMKIKQDLHTLAAGQYYILLHTKAKTYLAKIIKN